MSRRHSFSTQVDTEVIERVRATVLGLQAIDPSVTLASFASTALAEHCRAMEETHHENEPWPQAPQPMRRGPRIGDPS